MITKEQYVQAALNKPLLFQVNITIPLFFVRDLLLDSFLNNKNAGFGYLPAEKENATNY